MSFSGVNVIVTLFESFSTDTVAPVPLKSNDCKNAFTSSKFLSVTPLTSLRSSSVISTDTLSNSIGAFVLALIVTVDVFPSSTDTVTFLSPVKDGSDISTSPEFTSTFNSELTFALSDVTVTFPPLFLIIMLPDCVDVLSSSPLKVIVISESFLFRILSH